MRTRRPTRMAVLSPTGVYALGRVPDSLYSLRAARRAVLAELTPMPSIGDVMPHQITTGQVYVACDPREIDPREFPYKPRQLAVVTVLEHSDRVEVETLHYDGTRSRRRWMQSKYLHASATTRSGAKRTRGYVLKTEAAR